MAEASPSESYARLGYHEECEAAVNQQINVEYNISYIYHSLWAFFARDNVGAMLRLIGATTLPLRSWRHQLMSAFKVVPSRTHGGAALYEV